MGIVVKHVQAHHKTGRLSFRRAYPPELRQFIPAGASGKPASELKVSLGTKDASSPEFHARYGPALARYDEAVAKAAKLASGAYDALDAPTIAYLGKVYEIDWLARDEEALWAAKGPGWDKRLIDGWDWKLPDFKHWQGSGDSNAIEEEWCDSARALLAAQGLVVDPIDSDAFTALCRELNVTAIRVSEIALARLAGNVVAAPAPPLPPTSAANPATASRPVSVPLLASFDAYAAAALRPLTAQDWRRCVVHLVDFLDHDDAARLTADDLLRWRDKLLTELSRGRLRQAVTVRGKYIGSVKALLNWMVEERKLAANVALAVHVRVKKKPTLRSRDFTDDEAHRILAATLVQGSPRLAQGYILARRWIPWLCAYSGARVNELSQLRGADVSKLEGVWTIRITPEAGTVKNQTARVVPLHSHIIEQGFLEVVSGLGTGPLFYDPDRQRVTTATNRHVKKVGERLAAWVRKDVGITDINISPNHAWRHTFKTTARRIGMDPEVRDVIQGHAPRTEGEEYGTTPVTTMAEAIENIPQYIVHGALKRLSDMR